MHGQMPRPAGAIRAAQYIRMSTEHQRYSADSQAAAIELYAVAHGYEVVQTYADLGKSGLTLTRRPGLIQLLSDVESRRADFQSVLVYDVSRWGRFQDPDEAAACEATCKRAGVTVQYCAEVFDNDGSTTAAILKSLKRIMAAEYSRELSVKVYAAQRRVASFGFVPNRWRPYGMQRLAVDHRGRPVRVLADDELSIRGCRLSLVPGPPEAVAQVRRVFRLFGNRGWSLSRIAATLNKEGVQARRAARWTHTLVQRMLKCECYIGNYVFGKTTVRLSSQQRLVPQEAWVRADGAFEPIISAALFRKVQRRLAELLPPTDEKLLGDLERLIAAHGRVSGNILRRDPRASTSEVYIKRFGSLAEAYRLVGYEPASTRQYASLIHATQIQRNQLMQEMAEIFRGAGHYVIVDRTRSSLALDDLIEIEIRCRRWVTEKRVWIYTRRTHVIPDLTLCLRLDKALEPYDFCLLTRAAFRARNIYLPAQPKSRPGLEIFKSLDGVYDRSMRLLGRDAAGAATAPEHPGA
jgi:DNA invertase Pin-like site-specific DNA recombinase